MAERDFVDGIVSQLANAGRRGQDIDEHGLNFMLSVIKGIEARDQLEAMLAAQMAAVHMASMTFAGRLAEVETIPQQDSAERAFKKPTRTFGCRWRHSTVTGVAPSTIEGHRGDRAQPALSRMVALTG